MADLEEREQCKGYCENRYFTESNSHLFKDLPQKEHEQLQLGAEYALITLSSSLRGHYAVVTLVHEMVHAQLNFIRHFVPDCKYHDKFFLTVTDLVKTKFNLDISRPC